MLSPVAITMRMFMFFMFIVGIVMTIYSYKINQTLDQECPTNSQAINAARALLIMSVIITTLSFSVGICGCGAVTDINKEWTGFLFVIMMFILGITISVLVSIINSNCPKSNNDTSIPLSFGIVIAVISLLYLVYRFYIIYTAGLSTISNSTRTTTSGIEMTNMRNIPNQQRVESTQGLQGIEMRPMNRRANTNFGGNINRLKSSF